MNSSATHTLAIVGAGRCGVGVALPPGEPAAGRGRPMPGLCRRAGLFPYSAKRWARVRFGRQQQTQTVVAHDQEEVLRFYLEVGETDLRAWSQTEDGEEFSAYYVYIQLIGRVHR